MSALEKKGFAFTAEALLSLLIAAALFTSAVSFTQSAGRQKHSFLYDEQLLQDYAEVAWKLGVFEDIANGRQSAYAPKLSQLDAKLGACVKIKSGSSEIHASSYCTGNPRQTVSTTRLAVFPDRIETISLSLER